MKREINEHHLDLLRRARSLRARFDSGIFPSTIGDFARFSKLERLGLLCFEGWGRDIDGERENDVRIYRLTETAVSLLAAYDGEGPVEIPRRSSPRAVIRLR